MKRKGFTLAEVLITLGIIGIIASMSIPTILTNIQKQQAGPALAKAINTLETANMLALEEAGVRTLNQLIPANSTAYLAQGIVKYVQWKEIDYNTSPYYNYSGKSKFNNELRYTVTSKDGITFSRYPELPQSVNGNHLRTLSIGYSGKYYTVFVDVNGVNKGPNSLGKDLFKVIVDTKGSVIPYGGVAWSTYTGDSIKWSGNNCGNSRIQPQNPESCAGSIADNGFKVIY